MSTSGHHISAEPSAAEMVAMEALAAGGSSSGCDICDGTNLIKNASCEDAGEPPLHWTEVSGDWKPQQGGTGGLPPAKAGSYLFWAGNTASGELYQDVDVSSEATKIDAARVEFSFSAWLSTWRASSDTAQVIVEYRNNVGTVLESFDSGDQNVDSWTEFAEVHIAPSGTKTIRVRLLAVRNTGTSNYGFFDDLSLTARCGICSGMNLLKNPGCEFPGEPPPHWTEASGDWQRQQEEGDLPAPHGGKYFFFAGQVATGELYQDIDISAEATKIDAGTLRIRFSGWLNTWVTNSDTSRVIVEYRKADDSVIASYDTGAQNVDTWTNFTDAKIAPNLTRTIRVRLLAVRDADMDNDGYFDDLSLVAECFACGATVRFLDEDNNEVTPEAKALSVSNYVTNIGLPVGAAFPATSSDPNNFRLEVEDAQEAGGSVSVTLKVGSRSAITYTLSEKFGNKFRGEFLRLVTDVADDAVQGTQTVRCKLGDQVLFSYTRAGETCADQRTIGIGRPLSEDDNGTDQLLHDIRELKVNVVVFSKPGTTKLNGAINATATTIKVDSVATAHSVGTIKIESEVITYTGKNATTSEFTGCTRGAESTTAAAHADNTDVLYSTKTPAISRTFLNQHLRVADERFAQCAIRLKQPIPIDMGGTGDPGIPLPGAMLDGFKISSNPHTTSNLTDDEKAIVAFKDSDVDSIDTFFVETLVNADANPIGGNAYQKSVNNTGNSLYENFVLVDGTNVALSTPHEYMHVLLDATHGRATPDDPSTSLFKPGALTSGSKRIGPYPNDG